MKRKSIVTLLAAIIAVSSVFAMLPQEAFAGGGTALINYAKKISVSKKSGYSDYAIVMGKKVKRSDTVTVKSSKTSVARAAGTEYYTNYPVVKIRKPGKASITITVKHKNGKKNVYKCKLTVYKYTNPFTSCRIGDTDISSKFRKSDFANVKVNGETIYVGAAMKKGWTLKKIRYRVNNRIVGDKAFVKVPNNAEFTMDPPYNAMTIIVYNKSKKLTEEFYISITPNLNY